MSIVNKSTAQLVLKGAGAIPVELETAWSLWQYETVIAAKEAGLPNNPNMQTLFCVCERAIDEVVFLQSPLTLNPVLLWNKADGMTDAGREVLGNDGG